MTLTLAEKLLSKKVGRELRPGSYIFVPVDGAMASDTTAPQMIEAFAAMGGSKVWDPTRLFFVLDHAAPAPNEKIARLHQKIRQFAAEQSCRLYDTGAGICHHLMLEHAHVKPYDVFIGADSHTCTYGAITAFACGVGSTDLAAVALTGQIWLRVPESIRINLWGLPPRGVSAKDVMLKIVGLLGPQVASYRALEFSGAYLQDAPLARLIPFANMGAELGAKVSLIEDRKSELGQADAGAPYVQTYDVDLDGMRPQVSRPHAPSANEDVTALEDVPISMAFLGSCTNTRIEDLREAAAIVKGRRLAPGVRFYIVPATQSVLLEAIQDGTLSTLIEAGATLLPSGCGPCVGTHLGVPGDDENVISAANRNFKGRMGNPRSHVYLASPATVAASALAGRISNPQNWMD